MYYSLQTSIPIRRVVAAGGLPIAAPQLVQCMADALKMPVHVPLRGDDGDASSSVSEGEVRGG